MNIQKALVSLLILFITSCLFAPPAFCANIHMVTTKYNNEIESDLEKRILDKKDELFDGINNKDYEKIRKLLSPNFLFPKNVTLESFVNQISKVTDNNEFIVLDQYFSTLSKLGSESQATVYPPLTEKNKFIINNLTFPGNESYNLFLRSTNKGWRHLFFFSFGKIDSQWKIYKMYLGNYSINDFTAPKLYEMGKEARNKGRITSCVVYSWAIEKCIRPAPYLQYIDDKKYIDFIKSSYSDFNNKIKFPFEVNGKKIIGLSVETTKSDGLLPLISYLTDKDLKNPDIEIEVKELKKNMFNKFYGLEHDFKSIVVRAYNELPTDPNRKYESFGIVLENP